MCKHGPCQEKSNISMDVIVCQHTVDGRQLCHIFFHWQCRTQECTKLNQCILALEREKKNMSRLNISFSLPEVRQHFSINVYRSAASISNLHAYFTKCVYNHKTLCNPAFSSLWLVHQLFCWIITKIHLMHIKKDVNISKVPKMHCETVTMLK